MWLTVRCEQSIVAVTFVGIHGERVGKGSIGVTSKVVVSSERGGTGRVGVVTGKVVVGSESGGTGALE